MRVGAHPHRVKQDHVACAPVTVCVLVHVPHQLDYHAHRFDVVRLTLASLRAHTAREQYELMVLDNGSCDEVVDDLRSAHVRRHRRLRRR